MPDGISPWTRLWERKVIRIVMGDKKGLSAEGVESVEEGSCLPISDHSASTSSGAVCVSTLEFPTPLSH